MASGTKFGMPVWNCRSIADATGNGVSVLTQLQSYEKDIS